MKKTFAIFIVAALAASIATAQTAQRVGTVDPETGIISSDSATASSQEQVVRTTRAIEAKSTVVFTVEGQLSIENKLDDEVQQAGLPEGTKSKGVLHQEILSSNQFFVGDSFGVFADMQMFAEIRNEPFVYGSFSPGIFFSFSQNPARWWGKMLKISPTIGAGFSNFKAADIGASAYLRWEGLEVSGYGNVALAPWGAKNYKILPTGKWEDGEDRMEKWYVGGELTYTFGFGVLVGLKADYAYSNNLFGEKSNLVSPESSYSFKFGYRTPNERTKTYLALKNSFGGGVVKDTAGKEQNREGLTFSFGVSIAL